MRKMQNIFGWLIMGLGFVLFFTGIQAAEAQEQKPIAGLKSAAEIIAIWGEVEIKSPQDVTFRKAQLKDPLNPGDQVRTSADSRAKLLFRDDTVLILGDKTTMEITLFQADESGRPEKSRFKVLHGALRFILSKVYEALPRTFEIEGKTAVLGVRGTDGIFETRSPDNIYLISGAPLRLLEKATGKTVILKPGQEATVEDGKITIRPLTPQKIQQLLRQYRVAQIFTPRGMTTPPMPPGLLARFYNFGNPLLPQTSSFRSLDSTSYIYQPTAPTLHNPKRF